ncbi:MAG: DNA-binding protein HU [Mesoaciditoga sp.]|uniref:HU family DNA-binding protein n=1 Tax=Athalassotoga sp. TaxID=2022597 RepID=UPI000CC25158|nr:MAG: DNA-binding protein HU [Mesoaciditoga sp.]
MKVQFTYLNTSGRDNTNKKDLIDEVAKSTELMKKDVAVILDGTLKAIKDAVAKGDSVSFVGFGTFSAVERAARDGRNPKTGQVIKIKARKVPKFRAGKNLKDSV